ncbi:unnamed protein product [Litomosoides sigmodontis]|uniref:ShKT domain-containing protein n=1 Tax=Litomosoides sigmodontis TaxID=42156 RepID=A0A3P6U7J3_LITSI|nr:unnamed protein product [Litomosoides sigmodontis]
MAFFADYESYRLVTFLLIFFSSQCQVRTIDEAQDGKEKSPDQNGLITLKATPGNESGPNIPKLTSSYEYVPKVPQLTAGNKDNPNVTSSPSEMCYDSSAPGRRDSDCTKYSYLCDNALYYKVMTWQCPVTCGRCSVLNEITPRSFSNQNCTDLKGLNGRSDCQKYAMLCRDPRYVSVMATECPKTCRYCS